MSKMSKQQFKYLEKESNFQAEIKTFFIIFIGFSVAKNGLRPESDPLIILLTARINIYIQKLRLPKYQF